MKKLILTLTLAILLVVGPVFAAAPQYQHDYAISAADANTGVTMRAAINAALQALASNNQGATEPAMTYAYMWWADTTTGILKRRNGTNNGWINVISLTGTAQESAFPIAAAGGAADTITADYAPDITLADMKVVAFVATAANATTTPTFAPDGLTAHTIVKHGGAALAAGDIPGALAVCLVQYNLANTRWELMNPASGTGGGSGDVESVGDCTGGACLDGSSDGGTYIRLYDGNSHYTSLLAGDSAGNLSFYFPATAGAKGGMLYFSGANQLANLAHSGAANTILYTNAVDTLTWLTSSANMISLLGSADYATARTNLGLAIGTNVQAYNANLAAIAGLTFADVSIIEGTGAGATAVVTSGGGNRILGSNTGNTALEFKNTLAIDAFDISAGTSSVPWVVTTDCSAVVIEGRACWDSDDNILYIGNTTTNSNLFNNNSTMNLVTTGTISGGIPSTTDANGQTLSAALQYGYMHWATGAGTTALVTAVAGMNFCVYSTTAAAVVINPADADIIILNGAALSAGDSITSASGAGDFICLVSHEATKWVTMGRSGTWTDTN